MADGDDLRALRDTVQDGMTTMNTTLTDMRVVTAEQLGEIRGDLSRVEQKVDLRHEETQAQGGRILEAERDIDKLQQGHARILGLGGGLGAVAGIVVAFLKDAFGFGKG